MTDRPPVSELRLLGPLEAFVDGVPAAVPGGKARALLARLALEPGRVVAVDALVDALWGEAPPESAHKVVQIHVSQLRKALGASAIETRAPGYLLRPSATDLGRFEQLVERALQTADPEARSSLLREALALWRGAPLTEFRREPFAAPAARRLAELRLAALALLFDAELELGRHERAVPELAALVDEEPLREQPRRQLMLALYRCGRQADALAAYRAYRRRLVDDLGIEPGPALQELERRILRHDRALVRDDAPAASRGCVVCVGRLQHALFVPLGRELVLIELAEDAAALPELGGALDADRARLAAQGVGARAAAFTSEDPGADLARLAAEQEADLLVVAGLPAAGLLDGSPCDVAALPQPRIPFEPRGPLLVPFGGGRDEWPALELAAWLARAHGLRLRLLGVQAEAGRRDASRMLAAAALALQRFGGVAAEPALVAPGAEGILAEQGSAIVASLPQRELDATRRELAERARVPLLLVHGGLRPSGLAPERSLTRFSWSLAD